MNIYAQQFQKYTAISELPLTTSAELIEEIKKAMVNISAEDKKAVIVLGYSGNGKSTFISKYKEANPDYEIISMDSVARKVYSEKIPNPDKEIVERFGAEIERAASSSSNVIIDGNFLNLLTRSALLDTLKIYGYYTELVDLTSHFKEIIEFRIRDEACRLLHITEEVYNQNQNHPQVQKIRKMIIDFHEREKKNSFFEIQKEFGVVDLGANTILDRDEALEKLEK